MADEIDIEQILDMAVARHEAGQSDLAEAGYRTVLQYDPNEPDALNLLGVILQDRGKFDEAIALIARALEIEPDFPEALTNLARAQRALGAPAAAVDAARRAVALDPNLAEAHLQLGRALVELDDYTGATAALRQAVALAPQSVDASLQLGAALLQMHDFQVAADSLTAALALDPDRADAMISLGVALASLDRLDDAFYWHEKATVLAPNDAAAHTALAVTRARRQDPAGSIAACRRALDLAPDRIDIWRILAGNLASIGRFAEAAACYHKMLALDPYSATAQHGLAEIGQHTEDAAEIKQLRTTQDDAAMPRAERIAAGFAAGAALDRAGDYDAAFAAFEARQPADPRQPGRGWRRVQPLRQCPKTTASGRCPRRDGIIPFRMECVALDIEGHHLRVADLDALRIVACIKLASHRQASPGRGGRDQFDHCFPAGQGFSPPGLGDVAKQPMLDFVPLRGPRRIMADLKRQAGFVSQFLKFNPCLSG